MLGTSVGTYRITGTIGQGGMGAVYAAEHTLLGRPAAVKVLLPELSQNQEIVQRFFNEAKAATAIRHPGIIEIYDFGWDNAGSAYIVMELLQGESLASRLSRGRIGVSQAFSIARQIAGALSAAHRKGIVHRDLKPDNVFLVPDPEVPGGERIKLLDFGIAKLAGDQSMSQKTRTGSLMGTPTYMAPEQCRGVAVDHRADIYSLGCIVFEMISGRPPFVGEGTGDVLAAHIHVPAPALSTLAAVTPPIDQLVQRLLAKDPAHRFQTADEVVHAIDASGATAFRTAPQIGTAPHSAVPSMPTTLSGVAGSVSPPASRSNRGVLLGAAALAVVVIAVGLVIIVNGKKDTETSAAAQPTSTAEPAAAPAPTAPAPTASAQAPAPAAPAPAAPAPAAPAQPPVAAPTPTPPAAPATVTVSITTVPSGAKVFMDGKPLGTTPLDHTLPRGDASETLTFRLAGYRDAQRTVRTDGDIKLSVKLDKKRAAASAGTNDRDRGVNPFGD